MRRLSDVLVIAPWVLISVFFAGCHQKAEVPTVDQFLEGEGLYTTYCASCHEIENGIGPKLSKAVIATRVNAQLLFNYNQRNMPYQAGNTLPESEYWSITAYMLIREGFLDRNEILSAENAGNVLLEE